MISLIKMYEGQDNRFKDACTKAGIKPTRRQYKKYQRKQGKAFQEVSNLSSLYFNTQKAS